MDLALILKAVGALSLIGLVTSFVLATAARRFHVEVDPRVEAVFAALPGSNCGACGNPSCFAAAEAAVAGTVPVSVCVAGGQEVADSIASLMGVETCAVAAVVSCRHCGGGVNATRAYEYGGIRSCKAVARLAGSPVECPGGCIGFGDCAAVCPFDAIEMDERGLPVVNLKKCTGCGICVTECPRGGIRLLEMVPERAPIAVRCNSHDKPKDRKAYCTMCCIACKRCEKACPNDAIHVVDLLAVVDYEKCTGCLACIEVCPQDCIDVFGRGAETPAHAADGKAKSVLPPKPEEPTTVSEA